MDCGAGELACLTLSWIVENELVADFLAKYSVVIASKYAEFWKTYPDFLRDLIAAAAFCFGVWRWWRYREQILHKRLANYLVESDRRLADGQNYILKALRRPAPGHLFEDPLFAPAPLRSVLREKNWDRSPVAATVARSADLQLIETKDIIGRQLRTAGDQIGSLRKMSATASILRGAIAASLASRSPARRCEMNNQALNHFRDALGIPGQEKNFVAMEFLAHQLRKLGHFSAAIIAYQDLETRASAIEDAREKAMTIAIAKRFQAEVLQCIASETIDGKVVFNGTREAFALVNPRNQNSALSIRSEYQPFQRWELLEQADLHFLTAFIARNLGFGVVEANQLNDAHRAYNSALAAAPLGIFGRRTTRRLRAQAQLGIDRVRVARNDDYDTSWLLPGLEKQERVAESIGNT